MRRILLPALLVVVACGGPAKSSPPPVSNQQVANTTPPAPNPTLQQPTCTATNMTCAMEYMEYFQKRMCNCKDKACAEGTNVAMTKWGTEMAKNASAAKSEKPDPNLAKHAADVMTRYTECMTKLYMDGVPPTDPCGDPCGGDPCGGH